MSVAPYDSLTLANAVWKGAYAIALPDCYGVLHTPNPAEHPPGPNGWKVQVKIHGGGFRQSGPGYAESGTDAVALHLVNNFAVAVFSITYPAGGFEHPEVENPDVVVFPRHVDPFAWAIQFAKKHARNPLFVGTGGALSQAEEDYTVSGLSCGAYGAMAAQVQEDGTFPYAPGGRTDDPWFSYEHNHLAGSVRFNSGQALFSTLSMGAPGDFTWDTYGEFAWWGSYFYTSKFVAAGGTADTFDMATKMAAEPVGQLVPENPRVLDCAWYLIAAHDSLNHAPIKNLADDTDPSSILHPNHYTLGQIDPDLTSLHDESNAFRAAYEIAQAGSTRYRLKAGDASTNPNDVTAAVLNPDGSNCRFGNWRAGPLAVERITAVGYSGTTVTVTTFKSHDLAYNVTNVTYVGTTVTVTLDRTHRLHLGDAVTISGVASSGTLAGLVNGARTLTGTPSSSSFTFTATSGPTGAYTSGGLVARGPVSIQDVVSTGTLAGILNGNAFAITAAPAANQVRFTVGAGPTGAYTSGGLAWVLGPGSPEEDYYTFLVDQVHGAGWSLLA